MAVPTIQHSIIYDGNNSTSAAYAAPFPFLDAAHVKVAVKPSGGAFTLLADGQFTVTRLPDGSGGSVVTATSVPASSRVQVFRATPLLQMVDLPRSGALPSAAIEEGIDLPVMGLQELAARVADLEGVPSEGVISIPGGSVALAQDVATWADTAARSAVVPKRIGQLGVQTADDTVWIAQSTLPGDWQLFKPASAAPLSPKRLTVAVWSDAGGVGAAQNALISTVNAWSPDVKIAGGDNTYAPATYAAAHAAFGSLANTLEVLGNHDAAFWANHEASFSHIPVNGEGHRRYWNVRYGNLLSVYGLHSGLDSYGNLIEPDGNTVGGTQHDWLVSQLASDECRWKIAVFHHPPFTPSDEANRVCVAMDWPELDQMSAIFTGHDHIPWKGTFRGVPIFAVSGGVISDGTVHPYGALAGLSSVSGVDALLDGRQIVGKIDISTERFVVSYHDIWTGQMLRQFDLGAEWRVNEWGQEVIDPDTPLTTGWKFVGICPARFKLDAWHIATRTDQGTVTGEIYVGVSPYDGTRAATFTIPYGQSAVTVYSELAGTPRGAYVQVQILTATGYPARTGLQVNALGRQLTTL